jgi:hypoxanthine phosphoribosyltransferase
LQPEATRKVRPLIGPEQIAARVTELGAEISRHYPNQAPVLVCVLKGSFVFAADLLRAITVPVKVEFLGVRSYGDDTQSSGVVQITQDLTQSLVGEDVVVVEDIVDTGLTLAYICDQIRARGPKSLRVCALLHKPPRIERKVDIDYLGFTIDDVFVVGYGLDFAQYFRNLPFIGALQE